MKKFLKWIIQFVVAVGSILLISGVPLLISGFQKGEFLWREYIEAIQFHASILLQLDSFIFEHHVGGYIRELHLFPNLYKNISYSLQLLLLAIVVAIIFALIGTFLSMLLGEKARSRIKFFFYFFETLPDILIILLAQLVVVFIFELTGTLISSIAPLRGERIYWLPVFCLMILPMIQLYRLSMLTFEAEERKMYVELAKSLGFGRAFVVFTHIFRNAIISVFFQSKKTMWFMLSNLLVLELMFNIPGIMLYMFNHLSGPLILITILSFFLPIFFMYSIGEWYFLRRLNRGGGVG